MNEREFCYWLQGLFEVGKPSHLDATQTAMVREHLALVFRNVTNAPARSGVSDPGHSFQDYVRAGVVPHPQVHRFSRDSATC